MSKTSAAPKGPQAAILFIKPHHSVVTNPATGKIEVVVRPTQSSPTVPIVRA